MAVEDRETPTEGSMKKVNVPTLPPADSSGGADFPTSGGGSWMFVEKYDPTVRLVFLWNFF